MTEPGPRVRSPVIVIILHIGGEGNGERRSANFGGLSPLTQSQMTSVALLG